MAIHSQVHAWLDAWEQEQGQQRCRSFDDFVAEVGRDVPAELVAELRHTVQALNRIDGLLHRLNGDGPRQQHERS